MTQFFSNKISLWSKNKVNQDLNIIINYLWITTQLIAKQKLPLDFDMNTSKHVLSKVENVKY